MTEALPGNPGAPRTPACLTWDCASDGLDPRLVIALTQAAVDYWRLTGRRLRVTSGLRALARQAELMADMTSDQLRLLYARHGMPTYLPPILTLPPGPLSRRAPAVLAILQQRRDGYVSAHLYGGAADLDAEDVNTETLRPLLEARGCRLLDETMAGIPCLHVTLVACNPRLVRD